MSSDDYYKENSNVIVLEKSDFSHDNKITNSKFQNKYGLLKVYADWCGHCKNMKEMMNFLADELQDEDFVVGAINFGTYERDNKPECLKPIIRSFPTLLMVNYDGTIESMPNNSSNELNHILDNICTYTNDKSTNSSKKKICKKTSTKLTDK